LSAGSDKESGRRW